MSTKIDSASTVETHHVQSTASISTSSTAPVSSLKVSKFGAKSGFVIPKNKLSGSLIPIFRGGKIDTTTAVKEESTKQVQRKTKWGVDLTQDAAVRKGRALAYQVRLEQITLQLKAEALEIGDDQLSQSPKQASDIDFSSDNADRKGSPEKLLATESLELERREIIGEILRLNPSYKAPPDYKPLLKEAKVPIPVKAYLGNNFIGLLLGPESNTQKRLEEETGAKLRVHGTRKETGEKREITQADIKAHGAYEELYVNVTADTYEKIDTAVALIELLVAPLSGSSAVASTDSTSVDDPSKSSAASFTLLPIPVTVANQGMQQSTLVLPQPSPTQFQPYPPPWFSTGPTNSALFRTPPAFMPALLRNNPIQVPQSLVGPPPYFAHTPPFGPVPRTSSPTALGPRMPMQYIQQPSNQAMPPQYHPMPSQQPGPTYSPMQSQPSSTPPVLLAAASRPMLAMGPPAPVNSQPAQMAPVGQLPNRPLTSPSPLQNSHGPAIGPLTAQPLLRPPMTNMAPPPSVSTQPVRPPQQPLSQTNISSVPYQPNALNRPPTVNFAPPARPPASSMFPSAPPQIQPVSAPPMVSPSLLRLPVSGVTPVPQNMQPQPRPLPSLIPGPAPRPMQPPAQSSHHPLIVSVSSIPSFSPVNPVSASPTTPISVPSVTALRPSRPSSGDFTFQPLKAQVPASPTTPQSNSPVVQSNSQAMITAPQAPSFRPAPRNPAPPLVTHQSPSRPPPPPPPPPPIATFSGNLTGIWPPPRLPLPNPNPNMVQPMAPASQMIPPSFSPVPRAPNLTGPMPPRPDNPLHPYPNHPPPINNRPVGVTIPNSFTPGLPPPVGGQFYDPFSPTSISPQQQGLDPTKARKKPEAEAEYEDLMASVGVK